MESEATLCESPLRNDCNTYQAQPAQSLREAVIEAIAAETGLAALEVADEYGPLYDAIDPSALDSLFQPTETSQPGSCVTFAYAGYRVRVDQTGRVDLRDKHAGSH